MARSEEVDDQFREINLLVRRRMMERAGLLRLLGPTFRVMREDGEWILLVEQQQGEYAAEEVLLRRAEWPDFLDEARRYA